MDECGYENGKIYKVIDENGEIIYIGSTKQTLKKRWGAHHLKCNEKKIILIENYPCESRRELEKYEQKFIDLYNEMGLINQIKAYQSKEEKKEEKRKYNKSNKGKEIKKKSDKKYQQSDKYKEYLQSDKFKETQKEYQQSDKCKEKKKEYQQSDKSKEYRKTKANCPHCDKLMLKINISRHIKTVCKKIY